MWNRNKSSSEIPGYVLFVFLVTLISLFFLVNFVFGEFFFLVMILLFWLCPVSIRGFFFRLDFRENKNKIPHEGRYVSYIINTRR